ncbi:ABC transporter permease [Nanoarchaeota archaeon]
MIKDYIGFSLKSFKVRKTRTFLTLLGIFIGIAAVISLISLGQGLERAITEQFEQLGTNKIIVTPAGSLFGGGPGEAASEMTTDDLEVIRKVRGVKSAAEMNFKTAKVEFGDEAQYTFVIGMPTTGEFIQMFEEIGGWDIAEGRSLKEEDKFKATMGIMVREGDVFEKEVNIRDKLNINGYEFKVVGSHGRVGNPADDSQVYIPIEAFREIFDEPTKVDYVMLETVKGASIATVSESIKKRLRDFREVEEGEEDFNVQTFEELLESFSVVFSIVQAVLIGIAAISLLVGGVGIMNTMYTSVLQRTNEIGLMKAIGAKNSDILAIFLIESGFLGLVGGVIGVLIGVGLSKLVEIAAAQAGLDILKAFFPWYLILGALAFSFLLGMIAGVSPARQASKLKPVEALRYE